MLNAKFILAIFIFQVFNKSDYFASGKSENYAKSELKVNVLAVVQFPFTYHNSERGFDDGVDIRILKTIAQQLDMKLNFTKVHKIGQISTVHLK